MHGDKWLTTANWLTVTRSANTVPTVSLPISQLQVAVQGNTGGIRLGGDVDLYRIVADVLQVPDRVVIGSVLATPTANLEIYVSPPSFKINRNGTGYINSVVDGIGGYTAWARVSDNAVLSLIASGGIITGWDT